MRILRALSTAALSGGLLLLSAAALSAQCQYCFSTGCGDNTIGNGVCEDTDPPSGLCAVKDDCHAFTQLDLQIDAAPTPATTTPLRLQGDGDFQTAATLAAMRTVEARDTIRSCHGEIVSRLYSTTEAEFLAVASKSIVI